MTKLKYFGVLLAAVLLASFVSCVAPHNGDVTTEGTEEKSEPTSETESELESETPSSEETTVTTEPETTVRAPAADGFPNEAESDGTKRY